MLAALALGAVPAGCSDESSSTADRAINIYGSVLTWILDEEMPLPAPAEDSETALVADPDGDSDDEDSDEVSATEAEVPDAPPVYIVGLNREIGLQVQVELVSRFEERGYDLRFLDSADEALDDAEPGLPVRGGALLIGLGPVPEGRRVDVRAEVYRRSSDLDAYRFSLARWGGVWSLVEEPTPVEPEGFVAAP